MNHASVIVFADIAGSTALYERLGNARAAEAVTQVVQWLGQCIAGQHGRVVKTLGDGILAAFTTVPQAVQAVVHMMRGYHQFLREGTQDVRLQVRVGIAGGDVVEVDGDCLGDAVNLAARLCERASPGEVWVAAATAQEVGAQVDGRWVQLGALAIRGKAEPIVVYGLEWRLDQDLASQTVLAEMPGLQAEHRPNEAQLRIVYQGEEHLLTAEDAPLLLGRSQLAQVVLQDLRVSREHARIDVRNGAFILCDISRFGTWVRFQEGDPLLLRRDACLLHGCGQMALGVPFGEADAPIVAFEVSGTHGLE